MPRIARNVPPDSITHLLSRGVERRPIFKKAEDYFVFLALMKDAFKAHAIDVLNYVLMPNHFHIQALVGATPVGEAMHQLLTRYSVYFNSAYERVGHLFQSRYKSFLCRDDAYLVQLPVYLSRNPTRAGLVARPQDWEWSGHNELVSGKWRYIDLSRLEEVAGMPAEDWRAAYLELIGRVTPPLAMNATLDDLLDIAAQNCGISLRDLRDGHQGAPFTLAKRQLAKEAAKRGHLQTEIAAFLGCSPAAVAQLLRD